MRITAEQAKPIQTSSSKTVYLLTLNQKLDPQICPEYVIVNQDQHVFRVPKEFVGKDRKATILKETSSYYKNGAYLVYSKDRSIRSSKELNRIIHENKLIRVRKIANCQPHL